MYFYKLIVTIKKEFLLIYFNIFRSKGEDIRWTESERNLFIEALQLYLKDWKLISSHVSTKNIDQCKNFYHNYKKRLNLEQIIEKAQAKKARKTAEPAKSPRTPSITVQIPGNVAASPKTPNINNNKLPPSPKIPNVGNVLPVTPPPSTTGTPATGEKEKRTIAVWSQEEKQNFIKYFRLYGKNWRKLGSLIVTKTQHQIKNYFQNYKNKLKLEDLLKNSEGEKQVLFLYIFSFYYFTNWKFYRKNPKNEQENKVTQI